jgi:hypothetical protein
MLFDLRARGRRRTIQAVYLTLAILMGGGLVLFGIGGDVQGGLVDAFQENRGDDGSGAIQKEVDRARERTVAQPRNPAAWAELARLEVQAAGTGDNYDQQTGQFSASGKERLAAADRAWQRHLQLAGDKPSADVAAVMINAYSGLNQPAKIVRSLEIVAVDRPSVGTYSRLAEAAYGAGQTRKGDLAAGKAVELAPKAQRKAVKQELDAIKARAAQQAAGGGQPGAQAPAP